MIGIERKEKQSKPIKKSSSFGTVGILIGLCLLLGWCSQNQNSNKTAVMPTARPTGTGAATATTGATVTAAPTSTAVPTRIAAPTSIPRAKAGLPGLLPGDVRANLEKRFGCTCTGAKETAIKGHYRWFCEKEEGISVEIIGYGILQVDLIDATVFTTDAETAGVVLGFIATMPYDGAEPKAAREWVLREIYKVRPGNPIEATFGNVIFTLTGSSVGVFSMDMWGGK